MEGEGLEGALPKFRHHVPALALALHVIDGGTGPVTLPATQRALTLAEYFESIAACAGIGVDSGLPDFRGNGGFWKAYPAPASARMNFAEVASPRTFELDPRLAWSFYGHRLALYRATVPHEGFAILKR